MTDIDTKVEGAEKRLNDRIYKIELKWTGDMNTLVGKLDTNNKQLMGAILGRPVTPSGDEHSARGVAV